MFSRLALLSTTLAEVTLCLLNANPTTSHAHCAFTPGYIIAETLRHHHLASKENPIQPQGTTIKVFRRTYLWRVY